MSEAALLSPTLQMMVERLSAGQWRERKQAVAALREEIVGGDLTLEECVALGDRLLEGLLSPDGLDGRAASHEVLVALGRACVPSILERLSEPRPSRRLLVDLLGEVGESSHVPLMRRILEDPTADANLRASAATALGRLGGEEAKAALIRLLGSSTDMVRVHALDALRAADAVVPVAVVERLLPGAFTRKAAAALLGLSREVAALPLLIPLLEDGLPGVRAVAAMALAQLQDALAQRGEDGLVSTALARLGPSARAHCRALIAHDDGRVRSAAIRLCALAADADAIEAMLPVMDDPLTQERALQLISTLGEAAGDALVRVAERRADRDQEHVLRLIGALVPEARRPRLLTLLTRSLGDPSEEVSATAAEALRHVGDHRCLPELYAAMGEDGRQGEASADALAAILQRLGSSSTPDVATRDDLTDIAGSIWPVDGALARNLCRVAGSLGSSRFAPNLVVMLGSTDTSVRLAAAQALGQLEGEQEGISALSFALADEEPEVRAAACRALGHLAAAAFLQSLLSATCDPSPLVRAAAVASLVGQSDSAVLARFRAIIVADAVPTVVVQAIAGVGASGLDRDLTMLMSLGRSEDHEVVKASARALRNFAAHRATAALLGLLGHERWDVRWAAAEVLGERRDPTALEALRSALPDEEDRLVQQVLTDAIAGLEHAG